LTPWVPPDPWSSGPLAQGDLASYDSRTGHPSDDDEKPYDEMLVESSNDLTDIRPPFVGLHKVMELEVLERITLNRATFGPLIHATKDGYGADLEPLFFSNRWTLNLSPTKGKLARTVADRLEGDDVGVVDSRHGWSMSRCEEGKRGSGYW
jgi:hypothetical protein